jgi:uncharacterized protein (TIGR02996 family)
MRKFKFVDDQSYKFWNIELSDTSYTVAWGRIGTKGQSKTKDFGTKEAAQKAYDKIIQEKLSDGYVEITPPAPTTTTGEVLERAILDDPNDIAGHAAYADWLTEQGDPRGEFIHVQLALEDPSRSPDERKEFKKREAALLKKHGAQWRGDWAALTDQSGPSGRGQLAFDRADLDRFFERGILASVALDQVNSACATAFVRSPQTRLVRELRIGGWAYEEGAGGEEPARNIMASWPYFKNLRVFQLGWTSDENYGDFCHFQCHLRGDRITEYVERMPRLEELYLFADSVPTGRIFQLATLGHLRIMQIYHCWEYPLELLAANPAFANLTHVLFHPKAEGAWTNEPAPYLHFEGIRALLHSKHLTKLTHLRLRLTDMGDAGCEEIVRSGILKRLRILDLRHGLISDDGARILAGCPDLKNLQSLDVSRNQLTDAGIGLLKNIVPSLGAGFQYATDAIEERRYLFDGDYE